MPSSSRVKPRQPNSPPRPRRPGAVEAALDRLLDLALAWQSTGGLRAVSGVADALGTGPGSQRTASALARAAPPPEAVATRLAELSPAARALLEHVVDQGGEATTGSRPPHRPARDAATPAEELPVAPSAGAAHRRHGGGARRGGPGAARRPHHDAPVDSAPGSRPAERDPAMVDRVAAGAAFEAVRRVELLLDHWGAAPPGRAAQRRAGGPRPQGGGRLPACRRAHRGLPGGDGGRGRAAGAGPTPRAIRSGCPPTTSTPGRRWPPAALGAHRAGLARAALGCPHSSAPATPRARPGTRSLPSWRRTPGRDPHDDARRDGGLPPGTSLAAGTGLPSLVELVAWRAPASANARRQVAWTVTEAARSA